MLTPSWLLGVEADVSATSLRASRTDVVGAAVVNYARNNDVFGTVRGRVGYAANNWLFYATGGYAWSNERATRTQLAGVVGAAVPGISETASNTLGGWVVGGGIEYGLTPNVSIRAEYLHYGFERSGTTFPLAGRRWNDATTKDAVKIGVNWRLNWAP
jgi:opacity protein-like surface antigen